LPIADPRVAESLPGPGGRLAKRRKLAQAWHPAGPIHHMRRWRRKALLPPARRREDAMIDYTIYILNAARGRGAGTDVQCKSRAEVCSMARKMLPDAVSSAEIWSGRKLIVVIGAT